MGMQSTIKTMSLTHFQTQNNQLLITYIQQNQQKFTSNRCSTNSSISSSINRNGAGSKENQMWYVLKTVHNHIRDILTAVDTTKDFLGQT